MAFFNKADPAVKAQRDLETRLKTKRASRDDLVSRRTLAEAAAAAHRDKAVKLASDGGDDAALSAAETAMRREQDRVATLNDAITKTEAAIADLEREIAELADQRARSETVAAIHSVVERWATASAAFDAAMGQIVEVARESAIIVVDAHPLKVFLEAVQQQVKPEADLIVSVLEGHAKAVLAGTAPASLPKPTVSEPLKVVERAPVERMFAMKTVRWLDADGVPQLADQYSDVDLTPVAASNGSRCNAVVPIDDLRCRDLRGVHGGRHANPHLALDLDDETACRPPHIEPVMRSDPVAAANIAVVNRGPAIKGTISVARV